MKYTLLLLALLLSSLCFSQLYINPADNSKRHFVFDEDVTTVRIKPGVRNVFNFNKGVNYFPAVIVHDGDTSKRYQMEITLIDLTPNPPPAPVLKETVDDKDTRITYSTGWTKQAPAAWTVNFTNSDWAQTFVVNASATMTFVGKKIVVMAERRVNHGVAKIEVKQGTTVIDSKIVDMYSTASVNAPAQIYSSATLPQGTYTVTVSLNSITAGRDSMVLDSFLVFE